MTYKSWYAIKPKQPTYQLSKESSSAIFGSLVWLDRELGQFHEISHTKYKKKNLRVRRFYSTLFETCCIVENSKVVEVRLWRQGRFHLILVTKEQTVTLFKETFQVLFRMKILQTGKKKYVDLFFFNPRRKELFFINCRPYQWMEVGWSLNLKIYALNCTFR